MTLPLAQQSPDFGPLIIYLIIGAIWVVGRIATARRSRRGGSYEEEQPIDDDQPIEGDGIDPALREFVEAVTGKKVLTKDRRPPPRAMPQATPPVPRSAHPILRAPPVPRETPVGLAAPVRRAAPLRQATPIPRDRKATPGPDAPDPLEIGATDPYAVSEKAAQAIYGTEIGDADDDDQPQVVLGSMSALAGMEALRMPLPSFRLPSMRQPNTLQHPVDLSSRHDVRRAMMERIVLGPPRGLAADPEENFL